MRLIGPFEIGDVVARGGSSVVHLARWREDPSLDLVAKVATAGSELQLHHENSTMRAVMHPSLLSPVGFVDDMVHAALVLPRAACSLRAHAGRLSPDEVAHVVVSVAGALDVLHRTGFAHGDVSAGNILLRSDGTAILADFGDARRCSEDAARADLSALASVAIDSMSNALPTPTTSSTSTASTGNDQLRALLERTSAEPMSPANLAEAVKAVAPGLRPPDPFTVPAIVDEPPTMSVGPSF